LGQSDLGKIAGVSQVFVGLVERGRSRASLDVQAARSRLGVWWVGRIARE